MRKISLFVLLFSFIAVFSMPLSAAGANSSTPPPKEGVCSGLKAKGITKGLFGLCVAYCEAGANSERVLDNYNRKKQNGDPAMPCLEVTEPTLNCACWNKLTAKQIGTGMSPSSCTLDPTADVLFYQDGSGGLEFLFTSTGACSHYNSVTGDSADVQTLTQEQENECRLEILDLAARDFDGFDCLTPP